MVTVEPIYNCCNDEMIFISPVWDGCQTIAVLIQSYADRNNWPNDIMLIGEGGGIDIFKFKEQLRSIAWNANGLLWVSTPRGLGLWEKCQPLSIIYPDFFGGNLLALGNTSVLFVRGGTEVTIIERNGSSFLTKQLHFKNPTLMATHFPRVTIFPGKGVAFSLEHGLVQFQDGSDYRFPGATIGRPCLGLWCLGGFLYSLSDVTEIEKNHELIVVPSNLGGSPWLYQFKEVLITAKPSTSLHCFLFSLIESTQVLRGIDVRTGSRLLEIDPGIGEIQAMVDVKEAIFCFGNKGVVKVGYKGEQEKF